MSSDAIFQRIKKVRVADTVLDQIIAHVEDGVLVAGDKLPSERELVEQFQVARPSIREALRILEYEGVIEVRPGKGAYIVGLPKGQASDEERVRLWFHQHAGEVLHILQVRTPLETLAARLATLRANPELFAEIEELIQRAEQVLDSEQSNDELVVLDRQFHERLAAASGNQLLSSLVEVLIQAMVNPRRSLMRLRPRARTSWDQHAAILAAIRSGDVDRAEAAMAEHMENVRTNIIALQDSPSV